MSCSCMAGDLDLDEDIKLTRLYRDDSEVSANVMTPGGGPEWTHRHYKSQPRPPAHACVAPPTSTQTQTRETTSHFLPPYTRTDKHRNRMRQTQKDTDRPSSHPKSPFVFTPARGNALPTYPFFPTPAAWQYPYLPIRCSYASLKPGYTYLPPVDGAMYTLASILSKSWSCGREQGEPHLARQAAARFAQCQPPAGLRAGRHQHDRSEVRDVLAAVHANW